MAKTSSLSLIYLLFSGLFAIFAYGTPTAQPHALVPSSTLPDEATLVLEKRAVPDARISLVPGAGTTWSGWVTDQDLFKNTRAWNEQTVFQVTKKAWEDAGKPITLFTGILKQGDGIYV